MVGLIIMEVQYRIMENFMVLANSTDANAGGSMWTILIFYAVIIVGFYLLLIRPSSKTKNKYGERIPGTSFAYLSSR